MKRREIEEKVFGLSQNFRVKVEATPIPATVVAFAAGIIFANFWQSILLLLLILTVVIFALWFLAEEDGDVGTTSTGPLSSNGIHGNGEGPISEDKF